jgi:CRP-like cAMP-binding protein
MATASSAALRRRRSFNRTLPAKLPPLAAELAGLLDLKSAGRAVGPGYEIVSEGRPCTSVFLMLEGIAMRYRILRDGQRQILSLLFPGDFAGGLNCRFATALHSVKTLTSGVVAPVPLSALATLPDSHPRLAAKLLWAFSSETAIVAEHLVAVGRRSAPERIAHLLMELLVRLQAIGLADEHSYRLPLTQEMIGDALGLSVPYVNRVLHQLRDEGLVRVEDKVVTIDDVEGLSALADFERGYLRPMSIYDETATVQPAREVAMATTR